MGEVLGAGISFWAMAALGGLSPDEWSLLPIDVPARAAGRAGGRPGARQKP